LEGPICVSSSIGYILWNPIRRYRPTPHKLFRRVSQVGQAH
jgi:hypothetical protein